MIGLVMAFSDLNDTPYNIRNKSLKVLGPRTSAYLQYKLKTPQSVDAETVNP